VKRHEETKRHIQRTEEIARLKQVIADYEAGKGKCLIQNQSTDILYHIFNYLSPEEQLFVYNTNAIPIIRKLPRHEELWDYMYEPEGGDWYLLSKKVSYRLIYDLENNFPYTKWAIKWLVKELEYDWMDLVFHKITYIIAIRHTYSVKLTDELLQFIKEWWNRLMKDGNAIFYRQFKSEWQKLYHSILYHRDNGNLDDKFQYIYDDILKFGREHPEVVNYKIGYRYNPKCWIVSV
jgi:hypothetical protein